MYPEGGRKWTRIWNIGTCLEHSWGKNILSHCHEGCGESLIATENIDITALVNDRITETCWMLELACSEPKAYNP